MVYVTYKDDKDDEPNILSFPTQSDAEDFVKEHGLDIDEDICEMDW